MKTLKALLLSIILLLAFSTGVKAEFFSDIIVTSANGIWTDSRAYSTLNAAITAVGANQRTIKIVNPQIVTNLTVPANITLEFERDGAIANSGQLTINTLNIIADNHQIFTGTGDVDFAQGAVVKSSWFPSIDTALSLTNDDTVTMFITKQETLHTNQSVGNGVVLKWNSQLMLGAAVGITMSNIGQVEAGLYQIFSGAGNFRFRDGTTLDLSWFAHLRSAISHISTNNISLIISKSSIVDYSDSIPSNINIIVKKGGALSITGGVTLTIASTKQIDIGPYSFDPFTGAGSVVIGSTTYSPATTLTAYILSGAYIIDALDYGSGTYTQTTITSALTAIGTTNKATLLLRPGTWVIGTNADWSAYKNVTWKLPAGAALQIASGKTVTFGGPINAGLYQIFSCADATAIVSIGNYGNKEVYPEWWTSNTSPGTTDMTAALQAAINARLRNHTVRLTATEYKTTAVITLPLTSWMITLISDSGSIIRAAHAGDCLNITVQNENYGRHRLIGLSITGPNNYYSDTYTSTGAGVRMHRNEAAGSETDVPAAYKVAIRDCEITGFKYGILAQNVLLSNVEGRTYIWGNEYGLYVDGGTFNANNFVGTGFRLNKIAGIYSSGRTGGGLAYPTMTFFSGCEIETNVPYNGGSFGSGGTTDSMGIVLKKSYNWIFRDCYIENQDYAIHISDNSSQNRFENVRLAPGASGLSKVVIAGPTCYSNYFQIVQVPANATDVHVDVAANAGLFNTFENCTGVNFIAANILTAIDVRNNGPYAAGAIKNFSGAIVMPSYGVSSNPGEGTTAGLINGIGTATATLNVGGYGEVALGNSITGATTITTFSNLVKGQLLVIWNYQPTYDIIIKDGGITGDIVMKGGDVTFTDYGQMIVFYVNALGRAYEIGRNF